MADYGSTTNGVNGYNRQSNDPNTSATGKVTLLSLLRHHLRDWLWIVVMAILELIMYFVIQPFHRFVNETTMANYMYPLKPYTVPTWLVGVIAVVLPFFVFLAYYIKRRSIRDFHNAFLGLAMAIVITALFTDTLKNLVGMPRPNFFFKCFPDGVAVYSTDIEHEAICHPISESVLRDAYKSFPSGHVTWAFAGLGYLSLYFAGKCSLFDKRGYSSRVFWVLLPVLCAGLIGITRVNDYQHRWVDAIFASLLGSLVAYLCYRQYYPSIYTGTWAGYPYDYVPQGIFSHGLHGPRAVPMTNATYTNSNDVEAGRAGL